MQARIAYSTYFVGIGASGLYGLYTTNKDFNAIKQTRQHKDSMSELIQYSRQCGYGFLIGLCFGTMWPSAVVYKTYLMINNLDVITKNN